MKYPTRTLAVALMACAAQAQPQPASLDAVVEAARADAATRTGHPRPEAFKLVSAERVTWGDASLGCPQPGMLYTQALVPGYRVKLMVKGEVWDYHASERGGVKLCPKGQSIEPVPDSRS
jgi:hypothetical protein